MSYKFREHIKKNTYTTTCVSEDKKIIYMRCGRVGSTSIVNNLPQSIEVSLPYFYGNGTNDWIENITDEEIKKNYFVFTFVRNPFDRLVSAWNMFAQKNKAKPNFSDFVKERGVGCLMYEDGSFTNDHWFPQSKYVEFDDGEKFTNFIGKFESMSENWKTFAKQHKLNENLLSLGGKSNHNNYRQYYNDELIKIVSEIYQSDVELFDYEF